MLRIQHGLLGDSSATARHFPSCNALPGCQMFHPLLREAGQTLTTISANGKTGDLTASAYGSVNFLACIVASSTALHFWRFVATPLFLIVDQMRLGQAPRRLAFIPTFNQRSERGASHE